MLQVQQARLARQELRVPLARLEPRAWQSRLARQEPKARLVPLVFPLR